jgi:hypothetical protein
LRWNQALTRVGDIESRVAAHDAATPEPSPLSATDVTALAGDLRAVWSASTTDARLKKRIMRTVIHEVVADIDDAASEIVLLVHWFGGVHTELRLPKRRRGQRNSTSANIIAAVHQLVLIANDDLIAGILNRNGLVPLHSDYDWLIFDHSRIGRSCGATRSSMLLGTPGWRRIRPARSRVRTIW